MTSPTNRPLFSVVTPVYNPPVEALSAAVESVIGQSFVDWELILVDDCSPDPVIRETLHRFAASDDRIHVVERSENGHIVKASNDGLAEATGEFIVLLDHDDMLARGALARNAAVIRRYDDVDYIYSDEDKIDAHGKHYGRFDKPDWSPERLRTHNYCCHLSVLRADLVREVGGFRDGFDGSQDHDLILRVTERARRIHHIPEVLYHWRVVPGSAAGDTEAKPYAVDAGVRAVQDHLDRLGVAGTVEVGPYGLYRIRRTLPAERRVSIVIPTLGSSAMVWGRRRVLVVEAVRTALARTDHENVEVVVVYDEPTPSTVLDELAAITGGRLVLVPFKEKFNYSRKVNFGVLASSGDRIVVLNDDVEARSDHWLEELLAPLEEPEVGLTGAKLFFSSTAIQHAGLAYLRGGYQHPFHKMPGDTPGPFADLFATREVSGVTGACVGMRRETFFEVGGLAEGLPESFNDVDFCYKMLRLGYRILYMAHCEMFHFESQTREPTAAPADVRFMRRRWGVPDRDPYMPVFPNMPLTEAERRRIRMKVERKRLGLGR